MPRIYKILGAEEWRAAQAAGAFLGSAADLADGYIHFSDASQAPETAAKWFAGRADLMLLAVEATSLGDLLRGSLRAAAFCSRISTLRCLWPR